MHIMSKLCNKMYFCSGDHVKIYTRKRAYTGSFAFPLQFKILPTKSYQFLVKAYGDSAFTEKNGQRFFSANQKIAVLI